MAGSRLAPDGQCIVMTVSHDRQNALVGTDNIFERGKIMTVKDLTITIYADGADIEGMKEEYKKSQDDAVREIDYMFALNDNLWDELDKGKRLMKGKQQ